MALSTIAEFTVADTLIRYRHEMESGRLALEIVPSSKAHDVLVDRSEDTFGLDPIAHVKILGDDYTGGFASGRTMRNSPSNARFRYDHQVFDKTDDENTVVTFLSSDAGYAIEHRLSWFEGDSAFKVQTTFVNNSSAPVTLEMLTSFSLGGISPFGKNDSSELLRVHRFRSGWSAEGRLDTRTIEDLHLEPSWNRCAFFTEKFGQVGSMPVRGWFPFVAVEDTAASVLWGGQLAWAGSWQMEIFRRDDLLSISGGLADREFGHWHKTVAASERLIMPPASIATVHGTLDDLCDKLTALQQRAVNQQPVVEQDLPIIFNDWCTTWGHPSHERLTNIGRKLQGSKVKYLVADAGWYKSGPDWGSTHGDWVPSTALFPDGLKATADSIRAMGFIPGLWFEMENCGRNSASFKLVDLHLKRDGIPITVCERRFWDLNDARAIETLTNSVIDLLEHCGFGYLKVDYNETIGIGTDGADSLGEGLRRHINGVYRFFELIRKRLPDLVIENCSSGGHRLEPSMIGRTAMSSFSDAHETIEIPIIAANLHRLMLPRQSQIWAVLHKKDSDKRLVYSLAATFLGRMCLSGEVDELSARQWNIVHRAEDLYERATPIIKQGVSRRYGQISASWRHPRGWQALVRVSSDGCSALVVAHTFESAPGMVTIDLEEGDWTVVAEFSCGLESTISSGTLSLRLDEDFCGRVALLKKTS